MRVNKTALMKRTLGYAMFGGLLVLTLFFAMYVKSWWDEPLGVDGFVLWMVLFLPMSKAFPLIQRLMQEQPFT